MLSRLLSPKVAGLAMLACLALVPAGATAQDQKVIVTVNDIPITSFDVQQRINLWKLLGEQPAQNPKKKALNELIDDRAKIEEAKKFQVEATDKEIDARLGEVAKGLKTDSKGLKGKLQSANISLDAMRQYLAAQIAFGRVIRGRYNVSVQATPEEIDAKLAGYKSEIDGKVKKFMSDPRMQPVTVYMLQEISFPIDAGENGITNELFQSRAIEANQYMSRFKGCSSAKAAAQGIFNVKVGKMIEADGRRMPKPLKAAIDKAKPGTAIGPMRAPQGLQLLAYCGVRKVTPPKPDVTYPSRKQAENAVVNEKYQQVVSKYSQQFRKGLFIEYRDPSYAD